jgi:hypothetical protein
VEVRGQRLKEQRERIKSRGRGSDKTRRRKEKGSRIKDKGLKTGGIKTEGKGQTR